jgi:hypothetical protein
MKYVQGVLTTLVLAGLLAVQAGAATPKAYLRGPTEAKTDQSILLKFHGTVSDIPIAIEQVTGPEQVSLAYLYDKAGDFVYAECAATAPGLYRFCVIAEGTPQGASKPVRSYAFWDVRVTGGSPIPDDTDTDPVDPDDDQDDDGASEPPGVIPLPIAKLSPSMKLRPGQDFVRFRFIPKSLGYFTVSTRGQGAWRMELAGPDDWTDVIAVDDAQSGVSSNAKIVANLLAGRRYYAKVKPVLPYNGKPFTIMVAKGGTPPTPDPDPTPSPTPDPTPNPEPPVPPGELKVLFLQESEGPMTEKQLQVWHSGEVEEDLMKNTSPGTDGVSGYRKWDKDQDPSDDSPEWAEMLSVAKAELAKTGTPLPVVVIFRGGKGVLKPLPSSVAELRALIKK